MGNYRKINNNCVTKNGVNWISRVNANKIVNQSRGLIRVIGKNRVNKKIIVNRKIKVNRKIRILSTIFKLLRYN